MTCANILKSFGNEDRAAVEHYNRALEHFEQASQLINDVDCTVGSGALMHAEQVELKNIKLLMLEARTCLKTF